MANLPYDPTTDLGRVRLLINDVGDAESGTTFVLNDAEIEAFLDLEGGIVKLAAATAIDTNALNEALASKVIRTASGQSTDGAKLADAMHKLADGLRAQVVAEAENAGYFDIVDTVPACYPYGPELDWPGYQLP